MRYVLCFIFLSLSGCATFKDCSALSGDPDTYRTCLASNGDKQAQYELGRNAFDGGDTKTAINWLQKAALSTADTSQPVFISTGAGINNGYIMPAVRRQGIEGNVNAQRLLAKIYEEGLGVEVDLKRAEKYRNMFKN